MQEYFFYLSFILKDFLLYYIIFRERTFKSIIIVYFCVNYAYNLKKKCGIHHFCICDILVRFKTSQVTPFQNKFIKENNNNGLIFISFIIIRFILDTARAIKNIIKSVIN